MSSMVQLTDGKFAEITTYADKDELSARDVSVDHITKFPKSISAGRVQIEDSQLGGLQEINSESHVCLKNVKGNAQTLKVTAKDGLTFLNVKGIRLSPDSDIHGTIFASSLTGIPKRFHEQVVRGVSSVRDTSFLALNPYYMKKSKSR